MRLRLCFFSQEFYKAINWCSELDSDLTLHSYVQSLNQQYNQISGYTTFAVEPSPCQMSMATSDFNSSPESVISTRSGPMEYADYRGGLPPGFSSTYPRQETSRESVTDNIYCNLYTQDKPDTANLSASTIDDRYNPPPTVIRGDCIGPHHGQFKCVPAGGTLQKEWRPSLLKNSSSKPWKDQVDVDLRRCITDEGVSTGRTSSVTKRKEEKISTLDQFIQFSSCNGSRLYGWRDARDGEKDG